MKLKDKVLVVFKLRTIFFGGLVQVVAVFCNAEEQVVSGAGVGVGESKISACDIAIKVAKNEAAQVLSSTIQSTTEIYESDGGAAYRSSNIVVSKSSLKLIEKKEELSFNGDSGLITCAVTAYFLPEITSAYKKEINEVVSEHVNIGKQGLSGVPFCSDEMNMCFREYYLDLERSFGIQVLSSYGNQKKKLIFFDSVKVWSDLDNSYIYKQVTTENDLKLLIDRRFSLIGPSCYKCAVELVVSGFEWDVSSGYIPGRRQDVRLTGRYRNDIEKFRLNLSFSAEDVQIIDNLMKRVMD